MRIQVPENIITPFTELILSTESSTDEVNPKLAAKVGEYLLSLDQNESGKEFIDSLVNLWNTAAARNCWRKVAKVNPKLRSEIIKARKHFPNIDDWKLVIKGMEMDSFFSGSTGQYSPKILTLFFKQRYFEFYDAATIEVKKKDIVPDEWYNLAVVKRP
jgi:hypothetical protein